MDETQAPLGLFKRRVLINSGKGGVGKSTLTAALALLAARSGKRTLVVEMAGQCSMAQLLGGDSAGYEIVERQPNLFTLSVTPEQSMEEYLVRELHSKKLYQLIFRNRFTGPFVSAVPGLEDLVSIGKVMDLERALDRKGRPSWDIILVDAPATGQGLNLLRVPRAMMEMTRVGPFYNNTRLIHDMLMDPFRTLLNFVTLPEEMPTNETIDMFRHVHREIHVPMGYVFVNHLRAQPFSLEEAQQLRYVRASARDVSTAAHGAGLTDAVGALIRTVSELNARALLERSYVTRLQAEVALPLICLPALPTRNLSFPEVETLSHLLAQDLRALSLRGVDT